jgi:hypothetical protein
MEVIDICFLYSDENKHQTILVLEQMLENTTCNIRVRIDKVGDSYSESINALIKSCKSEYIVIFPSNIIVGRNWLEDLLFNIKSFPNAGCVGTLDIFHDNKLQPLLNSQDELVNVLIPNNNIIEGVMIFKNGLLSDEVGLYDKLFDFTGFEQVEFSLKFAFEGYQNFYMRNRCGVKLPMEDPKLFAPKSRESAFLINNFVQQHINFIEQ